MDVYVFVKIGGWFKKISVNEFAIKKGMVEVALTKPLSIIIPDKAIAHCEEEAIVVRCFKTDRFINNLPLFEAIL